MSEVGRGLPVDDPIKIGQKPPYDLRRIAHMFCDFSGTPEGSAECFAVAVLLNLRRHRAPERVRKVRPIRLPMF